jgi:hypothetical protein
MVMPARNLVVVHLVDTEAGNSVDGAKIGPLLWMILDTAGETDIGDPPFLERATGTRLTAATLSEVFSGKTLYTNKNGTEITSSYHTDHSLSVWIEGVGNLQGRWWVEGDNYCHEPGEKYGGRKCFQVLQDGNELRLFDLEGLAAAVLTLQDNQPQK